MKIQELFTSKERLKKQAQIEGLIAERDNLVANLQGQLDALMFERDALQVQKDDEARARSDFEIQLLTLQNEAAALNQVKESETKTKAQIQAQRDALEHENHALIVVRDKLLQEKSDIDTMRIEVTSALTIVQQELSTLHAEKESLLVRAQEFEGKEKFFQEENELLLLQLHQVQEELEYYFLANQKTQQQVELMQARFDRLMECNPDYVAYDALKTTPSLNNTGIHCELTNISMAGINSEAIAFDLIVEEGVAGFVFDKEKELSRNSLLRWPLAAQASTRLELIPLVDLPNRPRASALYKLTTRDWKMTQSLPALCKNIIQNSATQLTGSLASRNDWLAALEMTQTIFKRLPARLRWDAVRILRHKSNVDYEFLWLEFDALTFGARTILKFDMRFSCVLPSFDKFGQTVKLEFPKESGEAAFEGWFAESRDEFGEKYELRFALPNSMDTKAWSQITTHDRTFIYLLANSLPEILQEILIEEGLRITRSASDWVGAASGLRQYLRSLVASMEKNTQPRLKKEVSAQATLDTEGMKEVREVSHTKNLPSLIPKKKSAKKISPIKKGLRIGIQTPLKLIPKLISKSPSTAKVSQKVRIQNVIAKKRRPAVPKKSKSNTSTQKK